MTLRSSPMRPFLAVIVFSFLIAGCGIELSYTLKIPPKNTGGPPVTVLNNLVSELMGQKDLALERYKEYTFTNPRPGWVYVGLFGQLGAGASVKAGLDGASEDNAILTLEASNKDAGAMRFLSQGDHTLVLWSQGSPRVDALVIRSVPELAFCKFQYDPHVPEYGPYDWAFLEKHVLQDVNTIVGSDDDTHRAQVKAWKERGGRWITEVYGQPYLEGWDAERSESYRAQTAGMKSMDMDGIIVDEFFGGDDDKYKAITESVVLLSKDARLQGKLFYPYCGDMAGGKESEAFIQTVMDLGYPFAWERYLPEEPTLDEAKDALEHGIGRPMDRWLKAFPHAASRMVACLGYMTITESLDTNPGVDYKVWMDLQFNLLANDPRFAGLYGLMEYTSGYADEETVRWAARLYRHYGIDGRKDLLSDTLGYSYLLPHLQNPDFEEDLRGWTLSEGSRGNVGSRTLEGYSWLQGRYPRTARGDTFLWMRRDAGAPHLIQQEMKALKPGQTYSIRLISADYKDITESRSDQKKLGIRIAVGDADLIQEGSFQSVVANNYSHTLGSFTRDHKAWLNTHHILFRPRGTTAMLTLSDWASDQDPGGPSGQEMMLNFVQVQPYWME